MLAVGMEKKPCTYCKQEFYPSRYRPDQRVCSSTDCQRRRRTDYQWQKLATDPTAAPVKNEAEVRLGELEAKSAGKS